MSDELTIGRVTFNESRVRVIKAKDNPETVSQKIRRHEIALLKLLAMKHPDLAREFVEIAVK